MCRRFPLNGSMQRAVPKGLQARLLYLAPNPALAGHLGGTEMYQTLGISRAICKKFL